MNVLDSLIISCLFLTYFCAIHIISPESSSALNWMLVNYANLPPSFSFCFLELFFACCLHFSGKKWKCFHTWMRMHFLAEQGRRGGCRLMGECSSKSSRQWEKGGFSVAYSQALKVFFFLPACHCRQTFWWKLVFHSSSQWENCGKFHGNNFFVAKVGKGETEMEWAKERERGERLCSGINEIQKLDFIE